MKSVTEVPLLDVAEGIFDGPHATPPESMDGPIFLRLDNITPDGRLDLTDLRYINQSDFPRWTRRVTPLPGDVVFSYEATLHRYVVIPEGFHGCLGRRLALIRPNRKKIEPRYLHYYFLTPRWRAVAGSAVINGATVDRISLTLVRNLPIQLPSLQQQRRIVNILSAYDDLIENNRRRMALLEESARLLYQEWFVRLRFPGHEHTTNNNGVPHGWEKKTLAELVEVQSGFAFKSGTYETSGLYGIVTIKNVQDGDFLPSCDAFLDKPPENMSKDCHLRTGDILLSLTGNIGRCCLVAGENYLLNQRVAKLLPTLRCPRAFVYTEFRSERMRKQLEAISHGVAQQNLSPVKMLNLAFIIPSVGLLCQFSEIVEPMLDQLLVLKEQNQKLRTARDLLLPRLMSGEVIV
jgi:type I restriction enzyme, S subunit